MKFLVHILVHLEVLGSRLHMLKPTLKDFEHCLASM